MVKSMEPVIMTNAVVREISQEIYRKFALVSDKMSIHMEPSYVMLYVYINDGRIILPYGPQVITVERGHPILETVED